MICETVAERLSAYLDRELDARERLELDRHLDTCDVCRAEHEALVALRHATEQHFARLISSASRVSEPVATRWCERRARSPRRALRFLSGIGAVAAAAAIVVITLYPDSRLEGSPAELLRRASARYLALADAEVRLVAESEALEVLGKLLERKPASEVGETSPARAGGDDTPKAFRVILGAPNRFLIEPLVTGGVALRSADLSGFDGQTLWEYQPQQNTVVVRGGTELQAGGSFDLGSADFFEFLSWGFVREINSAGDDLEVIDVTGPYDLRVGRRVFELDLRRGAAERAAAPGAAPGWLAMRVRVFVDPRADLIEKAVFDVNFGGLSLVTLRAELVSLDSGLDPAVFDFRSHVGSGVRVVRADDKSGAPAPKRE
ncbi:MAG: anti-sigma factor family protein [Planctomycetota bacterium]